MLFRSVRSSFFLASSVGLLTFVSCAQAATYDIAIHAQDVTFTPTYSIIGVPTTIYASLLNKGDSDVEGTIRFYDNDVLIGAKAYSLRANGRPEDTWIAWTTSVYGQHHIRIVASNDPGYEDAHPEDNDTYVDVFVDRDTDHDGIPDSHDTDQDGDGILNVDEIAQGTDPLKADTDGDGVDDLHDAFPLDPTRSKLPPPPAPVATPAAVVAVPVKVTPRVNTSPEKKREVPVPAAARVTAPTAASAIPTFAIFTTSSDEGVSTTTEIGTPSSTVAAPALSSSTPLSAPTARIATVPTTSTAPTQDVSHTILVAATIVSATAAAAFIWLSLGAASIL